MPAEIEISHSQRSVLKRFAQAAAQDEESLPHWATILLAAADPYASTPVAERTGATAALVDTVVRKWKEAAEALGKAEGSGLEVLGSAIQKIYEDYEEFETECFCCCEDDDGKELTAYEIEMLAAKVYNLLRQELVIERERMGYAYFSRN